MVAGAALAASKTSAPTFHKDVLPILQARCQGCHRPGEVAPMSFLTYQDVRPWAKAIREAVLSRKMPPWFADPHFGKFSNDRTLPPEEVRTLTAWAENGASEGDSRHAPKPVQWVDGWAMGKPDAVVEMPHEFAVPAAGTIEYQYIVIPTGFTEDKWVRTAEARPGDRKVVHHIIAFVREPGAKWLKDAQPGVPFVPKRQQRSRQNNNNSEGGGDDGGAASVELLVGYAPGMAPMELKPGQAKLVKAGSDLVLQMHYTAGGKAVTDRSRIGLTFAKEPPTERIFTANATNSKFVIPAGAPAHEVTSQVTLQEEARLVDLMPHMHLRGKDFEYRLVYPTGETQTILRVPRYDFNWQLFYYLDRQLVLPKGTRIECTAHFDNSPNNPANPDPKAEVQWGDQSWEEMMIGWFDLAIENGRKPADVLRAKKRAAGDD
ncbi:MAG: thiol-disulfide isomerase [Acidobacteria bacterium]|nr:thiol-disulfide isomerase [Acidobacteriota bacterium]